jgi:hypothetical protein
MADEANQTAFAKATAVEVNHKITKSQYHEINISPNHQITK